MLALIDRSHHLVGVMGMYENNQKYQKHLSLCHMKIKPIVTFFIYLKLNHHLICQNTAALMKFTLVKNIKKKVN